MIASGGPRNTPPGTLTRLFFDALAHRQAGRVAGEGQRRSYTPISSRTVGERVRRIALGLQELGIQAGDRVAILSENRPEWAIADYACLTASLTDVPALPEPACRADRIHPERLRRGGDLRERRRAGGEDRAGAVAVHRRCGT